MARMTMIHKTLLRFSATGFLTLGAVFVIPGCIQQTATQARPALTAEYEVLYRSGHYAEAYRQASRTADGTGGKERLRAGLIAGLSAHALNRNADAERWLKPLMESSDAGLSGEAAAALGLMAAEKGKHREAVTLLAKASGELTGDDAARAAMYAGDSYQALGQPDKAKDMYTFAKKKVLSDSSLRIMIGDRLAGGAATTRPSWAPDAPNAIATQTSFGVPQNQPSTGRYSVQVAAFSTMSKAKTEATRYGRYGPTQIEQIRARTGRTLFAVRVGSFASKSDADRLRRAIGGDAKITGD
jgi:tetratricopeptide (TPR) repeat protein